MSTIEIEQHGQSYLFIYANGLRYTILGDMLASREDFEEIAAVLASRTAPN